MKMAIVFFASKFFLVCPDYAKNRYGEYENVSVHQAVNGKAGNMEIPSPAMVEAIHDQSSCKVRTPARNPADKLSSFKQVTYASRLVEKECSRSDLVSGHFKDIVQKNGQYGLYGWYSGPGGKRIQPFFAGHSEHYEDYSQAARFYYYRSYTNFWDAQVDRNTYFSNESQIKESCNI